MGERVLVVEDEESLRETLAYNLSRQGYEVKSAADGYAAVAAARDFRPQLILLDIMLPGIDGFEVCRRLRQEMNIPILMLTARDEEFDRVLGLEMGADDYITKPFSMRELLARVKAQLRRVRLDHEEVETAAAGGKTLQFDNLILDSARREARLDGVPLELKPKEFELLLYLAEHRGQALSREQILREVWGWEFIGGSRTVDVHVFWLRKKIELDAAKPKRIVTVRGAGYRFEG